MTASESFVYEDVKASEFVWDSLWRSDQNSFVTFNILDAVQVGAGDVSRWLFTSSEGLVKSKSKSRWTIDAVAERCIGDNTENRLRANISYQSSTLDWRCISKVQELAPFFEIDLHNKSSAVLYGHVDGHVSYLESVYEVITGLPAPKVTTFSLCGSKAKGSLFVDDKQSLPSGKIKCLNKSLCASTKKNLTDLVRIVESRSNVKVLKMNVIFMTESDESHNAGDEKTLWLHHTQNLILTAKKPRNNINSDASARTENLTEWTDKKSTTYSEIVHNNSSIHRTAKCVGDFCRYSDQEEIRYIESYGEDYSNAVEEGKRALRRHKRPSSKEKNTSDEDVLSDMNSSFRLDDNEDTSVCGDTFDCDLPMQSQAHHVPFKSIVLARQDMTELSPSHELSSGLAVQKLWPKRLQHWWWRVGKLIVPRRFENVPDKTHVSSQMSVASSSDTRKKKNYLRRDHDDNSENPGIQNESLHGYDDDLTLGDETNVTDMSINSYAGGSKRNPGKMNWYYSDAKVCERCYSVYRDIDERRRQQQKKLLGLSNIKAIPTADSDREIEAKIFSQKQFASRMSTLKNEKNERDGRNDRNGNGTGYIGSNGSNVDDNRYTLGSKAFLDSPPQSRGYTGHNAGHNSSHTSGYNTSSHNTGTYTTMRSSAFDAKRSPDRKLIVALAPKSPKGLPQGLPPLGQLREGEKVQKYQQIGSSFIRNIGSKARDMSAQYFKINSDMMSGLSPSGREQDVSNTANEWEQMTRGNPSRIMSEGTGRTTQSLRSSGNRENRDIKDFDPNRLLHKHQRELNIMRASAKGNDYAPGDGVSTGRMEVMSKIVMPKKESRRNSNPNPTNQSSSISLSSTRNTTRDMINQMSSLPPLSRQYQQKYQNIGSSNSPSYSGYSEGKSNIIPDRTRPATPPLNLLTKISQLNGINNDQNSRKNDANYNTINNTHNNKNYSTNSTNNNTYNITNNNSTPSTNSSSPSIGEYKSSPKHEKSRTSHDRKLSDRKNVTFSGPITTAVDTTAVRNNGNSSYGNSNNGNSPYGNSVSTLPATKNVNVSDYLAGLYSSANDDSDGSDDNDGEEEGIGWSPFLIPAGN